MSDDREQCDWAYRTRKGLVLHCRLLAGHDGPHHDEYDRWWVTPHEGGPVALVPEPPP